MCPKSNSNLNGADDHMIQLEIDIKMIFNDEHDDDVFRAQNIAAAAEKICKLLIE